MLIFAIIKVDKKNNIQLSIVNNKRKEWVGRSPPRLLAKTETGEESPSRTGHGGG
jgi:hypothetical protein